MKPLPLERAGFPGRDRGRRGPTLFLSRFPRFSGQMEAIVSLRAPQSLGGVMCRGRSPRRAAGSGNFIETDGEAFMGCLVPLRREDVQRPCPSSAQDGDVAAVRPRGEFVAGETGNSRGAEQISVLAHAQRRSPSVSGGRVSLSMLFFRESAAEISHAALRERGDGLRRGGRSNRKDIAVDHKGGGGFEIGPEPEVREPAFRRLFGPLLQAALELSARPAGSEKARADSAVSCRPCSSRRGAVQSKNFGRFPQEEERGAWEGSLESKRAGCFRIFFSHGEVTSWAFPPLGHVLSETVDDNGQEHHAHARFESPCPRRCG